SGKQRTLLQNWTGSGRFGSHARSVAAATRPDQLTCFTATRLDKIASEREAFIVDLAGCFLRRSRFGHRTSSEGVGSEMERGWCWGRIVRGRLEGVEATIWVHVRDSLVVTEGGDVVIRDIAAHVVRRAC